MSSSGARDELCELLDLFAHLRLLQLVFEVQARTIASIARSPPAAALGRGGEASGQVSSPRREALAHGGMGHGARRRGTQRGQRRCGRPGRTKSSSRRRVSS